MSSQFGTDAKEAIPALEKALNDDQLYVRQAANEALKRIQKDTEVKGKD